MPESSPAAATPPAPGRRDAHRPTLVVGYDGSEDAASAIRWAAAQVTGGGRMANVHAEHPALTFTAAAAAAERPQAGLDALALFENALAGTEYHTVIAAGAPAEALCEEAER